MDLNQACGFCGKTIRKHCTAENCRLIWMYCNERFPVEDPERWDGRHTAGRCNCCGFEIRDHYTHTTASIIFHGVNVTAVSEMIALFPADFIGCPETAPPRRII